MSRSCSWIRFGLLLALWFSAACHAGATSYYLHPLRGNDDNSGTNELAPFKTLARANKIGLHAGDQVLLAAGQKFEGQLAFENARGTLSNPIVLSSFPGKTENTDDRAWIEAKGMVAGVCLKNCAYMEVANLKISANGGGMLPGQIVKADQRHGVFIVASEPGEFAGFTLTNLEVKDIYFEQPGFIRNPADTKTANGTQSYGWGIKILVTDPAARLRDLTVTDCDIENVSHTGLQFTSPQDGLRNVEVQNVRLSHTGGPGVQMSGLTDGHFSRLDVNGSGSTNDTRNWKRGSGLWTWNCNNVVIEKSRFQNANGPGDSAGVHIDYNCRNVIVQKNFSANNAGGFCEILGNNYNCAYRYNVSVNDGWRTKGVNGAMQEGKTFWLSGYVGGKKQTGPFNTYFYNNTVFVRQGIAAKIAVSPTARGVLIANNIFYFEGESRTVKGDQTRTDAGKASPAIEDVVFKNNLFLRRNNWPAALSLQDQHPVIGDPEFLNPGSLKAADYLPGKSQLVKNRGITISPIPNDEFGLSGGLKMEQDILGQPVIGFPDLGAIETK